jgi:hypothetical protein
VLLDSWFESAAREERRFGHKQPVNLAPITVAPKAFCSLRGDIPAGASVDRDEWIADFGSMSPPTLIAYSTAIDVGLRANSARTLQALLI